MHLRGWENRLKILRISTVIIVFSLIMLLLLAGFTIYGKRVGNFVINVGDDDIQLAITTDPTFNDLGSRLAFGGMEDQMDTTYERLPDNIEAGLGEKNDYKQHKYVAYSFYLVNLSKTSVDYDVFLEVIDTTGKPLDIIRVMIIEGENVSKDAGVIYAKEEVSEENKQYLLENTEYKTENFVDDITLVSRTELDLAPNTPVKYTVVIWIEGWDPECDNSHLGDSVKLEMNFIGK